MSFVKIFFCLTFLQRRSIVRCGDLRSFRIGENEIRQKWRKDRRIEREEGTGGETASEKTTSCRYTKWISHCDKGGTSHPRLHSNYFLSFCAAQKRELIKFVNCKMHLVMPALLESPVMRAPSCHSFIASFSLRRRRRSTGI